MSVLEKQRFFREIYVRGRGGRKAFRAGRCGFCMEQSTEYLRQLLQEYKKQALPFLRYLPYFEKNAGQAGGTMYQGDASGGNVMRFPVYDGTLMEFVREASRSPLMDRNYSYVYTRNRIRTHEDERRIIQAADLKDCVIAAGRYTSAATSRGFLPSFFNFTASLAADVVFPDP